MRPWTPIMHQMGIRIGPGIPSVYNIVPIVLEFIFVLQMSDLKQFVEKSLSIVCHSLFSLHLLSFNAPQIWSAGKYYIFE